MLGARKKIGLLNNPCKMHIKLYGEKRVHWHMLTLTSHILKKQ